MVDDINAVACEPAEAIKYFAEVKAILSPKSALLRSKLTGRSVIADRQVAAAASMCSDFASPAEHRNLLQAKTGRKAEDCERLLDDAIGAGLFVSKERFTRPRESPGAVRDRAVEIDFIGIPTCDRPHLLDRLLQSLAEHLQQRRATVLVVDDSTSTAMQDANASVIAAHSGRRGVRIRYLNLEARAEFSERLAKESGVDLETVCFGVGKNPGFPMTAGAARNTVMLQSAGHGLLLLDDDVVCRPIPIPDATSHMELANQTFARWFLSDDNRKCGPGSIPENLLELHERALNIDVAGLAVESDRIDALDGVSFEMWKRISKGTSRVVASQTGLFGDCGMDDPLTYYFHDAEGWRNLVRSEESYRSALRSRRILSGARSFVVTPRIHSQTCCLGLDNRSGMPPCFPVMRGEDVVLGLLIRICMPESLFGLLPHAVPHLPEPAREFIPRSAIERAGRFSLAETMNLLITGSGGVWGRNATDRLRSLGRSLQELGRADDDDLRVHLQRIIDPVLTKWVQVLESRLEESRPGDVWAADVRQVRDRLLCGMNSFDHLAPCDLRVLYGEPEASLRLRDVAGQFANLLQAWPALQAAAQRMQE